MRIKSLRTGGEIFKELINHSEKKPRVASEQDKALKANTIAHRRRHQRTYKSL
jgi:hypothetical protein